MVDTSFVAARTNSIWLVKHGVFSMALFFCADQRLSERISANPKLDKRRGDVYLFCWFMVVYFTLCLSLTYPKDVPELYIYALGFIEDFVGIRFVVIFIQID